MTENQNQQDLTTLSATDVLQRNPNLLARTVRQLSAESIKRKLKELDDNESK